MNNGKVFCFLGTDGVHTTEEEIKEAEWSLSEGDDFKYHASCRVDMKTGEIEMLDIVAFRGE